jgi:tetratricopeptide (TPR) repeat protein
MMRTHSRRSLVLASFLALAAGAATAAAPLTRAQALRALDEPEAAQRLAGVARLAAVGTSADAERLLGRLADTDPQVRDAAGAAVWQLWSRSGDAAIDKLFNRGVAQMQAQAFAEALTTFSQIVRRKPAFAEGWNKRATVYFLLGEHEKSLRDCDEVLKRNAKHFGALSGAGQIHLQLGHPEQALDYFKRALAVNPNLEGLDEAIEVLEQHLRIKNRNST